MNEEKNVNITLAKLAAEFWRLLKSYERTLATLPPDNKVASVLRNSERKLTTILEETKMKIVTYDGQTYSPNLAVTIINTDEFSPVEELIIGNTLEPTIVLDERVLFIGKAVLKRKGNY